MRGAKRARRDPKDVYICVTMDNTNINYAAFKMVNREYPWLITMGCQTHYLNLLMEDFIENILQFVAIKDDVEFAVKFV